jgi:hypothetical protein
MKDTYKSGFTKPKWLLGLCVLGVAAAVAVLLATPPINDKSVYAPSASRHRPAKFIGVSKLSFNTSSGQPASQAQGSSGTVLGATTATGPVTSVSVSGGTATSMPPAATNPTPAIPDYFYPYDPPPACKFQRPRSLIGSPCGCGYRGVDITCIAPE